MSKKPPGKSRGNKPADIEGISRGFQPMYGVVIRDAIARGDVTEMRNIAEAARKQIADSQAALRDLDKAVRRTRV